MKQSQKEENVITRTSEERRFIRAKEKRSRDMLHFSTNRVSGQSKSKLVKVVGVESDGRKNQKRAAVARSAFQTQNAKKLTENVRSKALCHVRKTYAAVARSAASNIARRW